MDALTRSRLRRQFKPPEETRADIFRALRDISQKPYRWDGRRGLPVRGDALALASRIAITVCTAGIEHWYAELWPDGTINLNFQREGHALLSLQVMCEGVVEYVQRSHAGSEMSGVVPWPTILDGNGDEDQVGYIDAMLDWVAGFKRSELL